MQRLSCHVFALAKMESLGMRDLWEDLGDVLQFVFGEQVMFKPVGSRRKRGSLEARVSMGRYVGSVSRNADLLIMTTDGISRGHSLHRRPEDEKRRSEVEARGLSWKMTGPQERATPNRLNVPGLKGEQPMPLFRDFEARNLCVT